jgi:hypothetical protein
MSSALFEEAYPEIANLWHRQPPTVPFFAKLRPILQFYRNMCKNRTSVAREDEDHLKHELEVINILL